MKDVIIIGTGKAGYLSGAYDSGSNRLCAGRLGRRL